MSLLTKPENSTTATTPLRKPDSLRIRQSDSDAARTVPLIDGKTTIGSSPQCTIVLPASECRPLQCVITRDAHRAEATRWGAGVQLNRRDFTKSIVGVGDKLSIGCCELEFAVADPLAAVANTPQTLSPVTVAPPAPLPPAVEPPKAEAVEAKPPESVIAASAPQPAPAAEAPKPTVVKLLPVPTPVVALPAVEPVEAKISTVEPLAPQPVAVEPFVEAPAAVQPSALPKAITVPVVSSPTLIAPVAPACSAASAPQASPAAVTPALPHLVAVASAAATVAEEAKPEADAAGKLNCTTSQQFADELILQLWQSSDAARRRARTLIAAARDARFRADAMNDDLSAMEVELDLARAAYDSHAANHEKLHLEIIERDRQAAERLAPLVNEVESLRSQLQESQIELAEQAARCDELSAALDVQAADKAAADAQLAEAHRASELEQSLNVQIEQATLLARELGAVRTELDAVRTQLDRQLARQQEVEADFAGTRQQCESLQHAASELAECEATIGNLRDEVAGLHAERSDLHGKLADSEGELHRLAEMYLAHTSQPPAQEEAGDVAEQHAEVAEAPEVVAEAPEVAEAADHFALVEPVHADEPTPQEADASASFSDDHAFAAVEPVADHVETAAEPEEHHGWPLPVALEAEPVDDAHAEIEPTPTDFAPLSPFPLVAEPTPTPAPVEHESHESAAFAPPQELKTVPVESETATSSFIDKYRHLLDDEPGEPSGATLQSPLGAARPMLDDEFLSPAKAAERTAHADDSDEALEAYMANMMARMRGVSASSMVEPAPLQPAVELPVVEETPSYDPSVPFEIESMKQGRRAPISTDLAALREIANSSARSAIATHRNKRKMESAAGKVVIAIAAFGASGFLMSSAPTLLNWQFLAGIAVAIIGFGAAALAVRGRADGDHFVDALPASFTEDEREHGV
ncbi:FHA domain-containing protein [Lacipirellula parvula]|uniref:FHA domain-containing protein n=1 Tax=Lacipirellula parvula TaxID=2650471 RepID=A0A5K7XP22_9BACT|nr:FHA domain-containing protein [Lacipirellula parvula]BBO35049.1 hypothetical protein PLANPX_4661 [Lacipirellula parvula]